MSSEITALFRFILNSGKYNRLREEISQLEDEHTTLKHQKAFLEAGDKEFIEKIAREKFGMIKDGEVLYRVVIGKDSKNGLEEINSLPDSYDTEIP